MSAIASNKYTEVAGIIGGVGPEATSYFISLLVKYRAENAKKDQDHIPFLVFNNPQIPDRTKHLVFGKISPLEELVRSANLLKESGATFLVMPCNTCHAYAKDIEAQTSLEVLNLVELSVRWAIKNFGKKVKIGLLATDGTIKSNIYQQEITKQSPTASIVTPDEIGQENVMNAIYDIKSNSVNSVNFQLLFEEAERLIDEGVNVVVLGCTEIPLALTKKRRLFPAIDPMEILAREVVKRTVNSRISTKSTWENLPAAR